MPVVRIPRKAAKPPVVAKAAPKVTPLGRRATGGKLQPTRERLLETALEVIWEHSYASVSVDDICRRAGVLKGSFYHFFPSKAALAVAALEHRWNHQVAPKMEKAFSKKVSPYERLSRYYDFVYENQRIQRARVGRTCGCSFATIGAEQCRDEEQIRLKTMEVFNRYLGHIVGALEDAAADGSLVDLGKGGVLERAQEIFCFVHGILMQARVDDDLGFVKRFKPAFLRISGVRPS